MDSLRSELSPESGVVGQQEIKEIPADNFTPPPIDRRGKRGPKRGTYEDHLWVFLWDYLNKDMSGDPLIFEDEPLAELMRRFESYRKDKKISVEIPERSSLETAIRDLRQQIFLHVEEHGNPLDSNTGD